MLWIFLITQYKDRAIVSDKQDYEGSDSIQTYLMYIELEPITNC